MLSHFGDGRAGVPSGDQYLFVPLRLGIRCFELAFQMKHVIQLSEGFLKRDRNKFRLNNISEVQGSRLTVLGVAA